MRRSLRIVALALAVGAALVLIWSQRIEHRHRWIVLNEPIRLEEGFTLSQPFTVDIPAFYRVEVECRKTIPLDDLERVLMKELAVECAVVEGDHELATSDASRLDGASFGNDFVSRWSGTFDGAPDHSYMLKFHVTHSLPALSSTLPVVKIAVDPSVFKDAFVKATLFAYLAIALALVSAASFLVSFLFRRQPVIG